MAKLITDKIYLGTYYDVIKNGELYDLIINVMNLTELDVYDRKLYFANEKSNFVLTPTLRTEIKKDENGNQIYSDVWVDPFAMNLAVRALEFAYQKEQTILVHCAAGQERSPLVIIWWFHKYRDKTVDEAYEVVKSAKSDVSDRRAWLKKLIPPPIFNYSNNEEDY